MLPSPGGKGCGLSSLLISSVSETRPGIVFITIVSFSPRFSGTTTSGHLHGPGSMPIRSSITPVHHQGGFACSHGNIGGGTSKHQEGGFAPLHDVNGTSNRSIGVLISTNDACAVCADPLNENRLALSITVSRYYYY